MTAPRGLAFCGVTGAGKSTLTTAVVRRLAAGGHSAVLLQNKLLQSPGAEVFATDGAEGLRGFLAAQARRCAAALELLGPAGYLVCESLGVNLLVECGLEDSALLSEVDSARAELGIVLVRLHFGAEQVLERSVLSTVRHRGPGWQRYLRRFGPDPLSQAAEFRRRREQVDRHFQHSAEPKMSISTESMAWDAIADQLRTALTGGTK
ncbi:hypothetical protein [Crossiella cryophila]|uniref:Dephospho-CoA kinase n=1 Tax=Crossiella cryophila TaxID=43355 RepID=A0A7W7CFY9_9PSEU|nr:hypothetical protein [Crossiella cryophila]MBB4678784.1 hypothetical protein [Crossiella cryophila]